MRVMDLLFGKSAGEVEGAHDEMLNEAKLVAIAEENETHSFEIDPAQVRGCAFNMV